MSISFYISKCLRQPPHRALKRSVSTCRCDSNVFLCKVVIFFQIITLLDCKFEEAGWTANSSKKSSKNLPKIFQNGAKMVKKSIPRGIPEMIDPKRHPRGSQEAAYPIRVGHLGASWGRLGASWAEKVANMAPTWLPKRSQDGPKIHQNFDHFLDASWDRFFDDF